MGYGKSIARKATTAQKYFDFIENAAIIKAESGLPKRITLPNEKLKVTVNVELPGLNGIVPKGTELTSIYAMAGEGTSTPIRDLKRLHAEHGGNPAKWQKKSGEVYADSYKYVVHWYERDGFVSDLEIKVKGVKRIK